MADATNTVTGYVEYYYWLHTYCDPAGQGAMSQANWDVFGSIEMYNDKSDPTANMEHLFNMVDLETGGDPKADSLFNLTTLK